MPTQLYIDQFGDIGVSSFCIMMQLFCRFAHHMEYQIAPTHICVKKLTYLCHVYGMVCILNLFQVG